MSSRRFFKPQILLGTMLLLHLAACHKQSPQTQSPPSLQTNELETRIDALHRDIRALQTQVDGLVRTMDLLVLDHAAEFEEPQAERDDEPVTSPDVRAQPPQAATEQAETEIDDHEPPLLAADVPSAYQLAFKQYEERHLDLALRGFQRIVGQQPEHMLAPNALYWSGEIHFDRKHFNQAILVFQRVIEQYPNSRKAPDALLKLGRSREKLGQNQEAQEEYRRVLARYPRSAAARLANQWLKESP